VLCTPQTSLEKAVQFIKGGFSYRAKKELGSNLEIWQKGFSDHRIRDASDYQVHQIYVQQNPVRRHLCELAEDYPYSSARPGFDLDPIPQGLKPTSAGNSDTARLEGVLLQNQTTSDAASLEGVRFQNDTSYVAHEAAPSSNKIASRRIDAAMSMAKSKTA
jgi:hypothetical protein